MPPASALDILVVDDDAPLRDMLTRSFEREGHRVTAVPDGREALERAAEQDFDVVLLAVALGAGPAGHDVARARRPRGAATPPARAAPAAPSCRSSCSPPSTARPTWCRASRREPTTTSPSP